MVWKSEKQFKRAFPRQWSKNAQTILEAASVLVEAEKELDKFSFNDLRRNLQLSKRTDQRLRKVGRDKRLYASAIKKKLPDSWGTIEKISSLSETKFRKLVDSGLLRSTISRREVEDFKRGETKAKKKQDWQHWEKLITIRVKSFVDEVEANEIINDVSEAVYGMNHIRETDVVQIEDHGLVEKIESRKFKTIQRDIDKAAKDGLRWGKKICRYMVNQQKKKASDSEKKMVKLGQATRSWSMDETRIITDFDDLQTAFDQLGIQELTAEELRHNPDAGHRFYEQLTRY